MSDPLIFLILSFRPAREIAYFTEGWCWLKDILEMEGLLPSTGSPEDVFYLHFNS